jgi:hypothetical protein
MKRTLTLKKDSLTELTTDELGSVAGGTGLSCTCALLTLGVCAVVTVVVQTVVEGCLP